MFIYRTLQPRTFHLLVGCATVAILGACAPDSPTPDNTPETDCTWATAGAACTDLVPGALFDMDVLKGLSLAELGWTETSRTDMGNVLAIHGDWSGGTFNGYNADGDPQTIELTEAAVIYVPKDWPRATSGRKGMVVASHHAASVKSPVAAEIADYFGIPVLYHGQHTKDWKSMGYPGRNEISRASGPHLLANNTCQNNDFVTGNFVFHLARTDIRAITLLQRLTKANYPSAAPPLSAQEEAVETVALRGFSKEGAAAWKAALVDDRIEVLSAGGIKGQDALTSHPVHQDTFGCAHPKGLAAAQSLDWLLNSPAGAANLSMLSVHQNKDHIKSRMLLLDADVGMGSMHDGSNDQALGSETPFLDALVERPWRFVRQATAGVGDTNDAGGEAKHKTMIVLTAELLMAEQSTVDDFYPKVTAATATELGATSFSVASEASTPTESMLVWWGESSNGIWNDADPQSWNAVPMTSSGAGTWTSPEIEFQPGNAVAWYVEASNSADIPGTDYRRVDSSAVRFIHPFPAAACDYTPTDWCATP